MSLRIGIDLGGTKIELCAFDGDGALLWRERAPTPHAYRPTIEVICALVRSAEQRLGRRGTVGVCIPGAPSPRTGLVKNSNAVWLIGEAFDRDLAESLGRPIRVQNDANCFALSEATDGAALGHEVVFGVILGSGVGGGVVVRGAVVTGKNAIAGEWGHNPLPWATDDERPGAPCYCGKSGCIETFLSGPGLARDFATATGQAATAAEIGAMAETGDLAATATLERYEERLARALASVINVLDPGAIVLGGGLSRIGRLYTEVPRRWCRFVFSDCVDTALLPPRFGDSSGVRGAARLWP